MGSSSRKKICSLPSLSHPWQCPKKPWSFEPVRQQRRRHINADGARPGQAVLQLPLMHADVSVHLPPSIQLSATPAGLLDCRLQLLSFSADWPASRDSGSSHSSSSSSGARVLPAKSPALGFAQRCAALLLAQALFPEHTTNLLSWLAVPLALADGAALVAAATPPAVRRAASERADRLKARRAAQRSGNAAGSIGWLGALGGVAAGSLHTIRCLSGPAATLATAGWLWGLLHPDSHALCSCMVALAAVAAEYSQLSNDVSRGKIGPGRPAEAAWRACHKAAAQRLAGFLGDLPASPPLQPFLHAASCCSIAAGLAVDGQGLCGDTRQPWGSLPAAGSVGGGGGGAQLLLTGSVCPPGGAAAGSLDAASGLSRAQLLELFIGCADEPPSQQQEPHADTGSTCRITELDSSSVAPQPGAAPSVQAQASPQQREKQQLKPHGRAAQRPERPVVRVVSGDGSPPPSVSDLDGSSSSRDGWKQPAAPAAGEAGAAGPVCCRDSKSSSSDNAGLPSAAAAGKKEGHDEEDVLAFLEDLPLYGQQDHKGALAAATGSVEPDAQDTGLHVRLQLCLRALYLLLVFAPFLLLGAPMLLMAWHLLAKAEQQQDKPQQREQLGDGAAVAVVTPCLPDNDSSSRPSSSSWGWRAAGAGVMHAVRHPLLLLLRLLVQLGLLLGLLFDVLLILLLGGHWAAGLDPHVSAGLFLRRKAWQLLLFSCSNAGAAFIKWGQWSSSRRDIFPEDFCDTFSRLHDKAPVHSFRWTRRLVQEALGAKLEDLFESFDRTPLASGSIAQVHKATLSSNRHLHLPGCAVESLPPAASETDSADQPLVVAVKVCHPNVAQCIRLDFRLLTALSEAASRLPALRGLSIRQSVAQFSHTMTAQTDLRVEAVHALRFFNNFAGVRSAICVPRPIPGLVSEQVLVETFEPGRSVATFMQQPSPLNTHIVALGVDAFLHMLLKDNWIHSDLHPGNILFRQREEQPRAPSRLEQQLQRQGQEAGKGKGPLSWLFRRLRRQRSAGQAGGSGTAGEAAPGAAAAAPAQWELELQQMISQQQQSWEQRHGAAAGNTAQPAPAAAAALDDGDSAAAAAAAAGAAHLAQLVLLDFGLAEELTPEVRHHFVSFLNAIAAGDGLSAARHLLRWSHRQTCDDRTGFTRDVMDLFECCADIQSPAGIDLDVVMKGCLSLARKHGVSIDSQYASLVISVCVLVGFAKALDPAVNLMDAATPTLLAYQTTGLVIGRLYS